MSDKNTSDDGAPSDGPSEAANENRAVIRGAGLIFLGRLGALIEPATIFVFAKLYGVPTYGFFVLLWTVVQFVETLTDVGMTSCLQRFVPSQKSREDEHRVVRIALIVSTSVSVTTAIVIALAADWLAPLPSTDNVPLGVVASVIRVYAFAIPLWCFIDVATAAIRAQRVFGPEIRVRIFYEQGLRLVSGVLFFSIGWDTIYGLVVSHLLALAVAAFFAARLLMRFYDIRLLLPQRDALSSEIFREMRRYGSLIVFNNAGKKLYQFLPVTFLNALIPGAAGASAVAVYSVARKFASMLTVVRQTFEYVLAPFASDRHGKADMVGLHNVYAFATRMILSVFIPIATALIVLAGDFLGLIRPEFLAGVGALIVLTLGRGFEAASGPSSAVVEMIGLYRIPLINAFAGNLVAAVLCILLIPDFGITGGAMAAAIGLNVTAYMALAEVYFLHHLLPYDRKVARPLAVTVIGSGLFALAVTQAGAFGSIAKFSVAAPGLILLYYAVLNLGLSADDRTAIDPKGKLRRFRLIPGKPTTQG